MAFILRQGPVALFIMDGFDFSQQQHMKNDFNRSSVWDVFALWCLPEMCVKVIYTRLDKTNTTKKNLN